MLIGLTGKIGCGKTTTAEYLVSKGFVEYSFAKPLKDIGQILGFSYDDLYVDKNAINSFHGISGRKFMQTFGTEVCRDFLPTVLPSLDKIWIRLFEKFVKDHPNTNIVVSDVRFEDEYDAVKRLRGTVIQIIRSTLLPPCVCEKEEDKYRAHFLNTDKGSKNHLFIIAALIDEVTDQVHSSEKLKIKADWVVFNAGSIQELHLLIDFC